MFVMKFLNALGRCLEMDSVTKAIKVAKKREESNPATSEWGRSSWFEALGGDSARNLSNRCPFRKFSKWPPMLAQRRAGGRHV
jgi:hypothetical protein